jgi:TPR repeat protein
MLIGVSLFFFGSGSNVSKGNEMTHRRSLKVLLVGFFVLLLLGSAVFVSGCEEKHERIDKKAALALFDTSAEKARTLLEERRISAKAGDADAQYELGFMYATGVADEVEAVKWYRKSAEQGNVDAQFSLGNAYVTGDGVERNGVLGYMWLDVATMQGHEFAKGFRDIAVRLMTEEQIAEAQKIAREWQAANQGE